MMLGFVSNNICCAYFVSVKSVYVFRHKNVYFAYLICVSIFKLSQVLVFSKVVGTMRTTEMCFY